MEVRIPDWRSAWWRLAAPYDTKAVDDDLLRHLVSTVYSDRISRYSSTAMSLGLMATAWIFTGSWVFAVLTVLAALAGAMRFALFHRYPGPDGAGADRAATLAFDRKFAFWTTIYSLMLGLSFYWTNAAGDREIMLPIAVGAAVGYPIAFATSHAGRPRMLFYQLLALLGPIVYGYLTLPVAHGGFFATLFIGMGACAFVLGRSGYARIVSHYRTDENNRHLARYDTLTGLLNRYAFNDALTAALRGVANEAANRFALFTIDLDRFKEINDTEGHAIGDAVIVESAARLREAMLPRDVVARLGGDEFVVLADCRDHECGDVCEFAGRIVDAISRPVEVDGVVVPLTASVGVALSPDHASDATELMKRSDIALYEAKRSGRGRFGVFSQLMQSRLDTARALELEMERAIREDQFEVWFQPIHDIDSAGILGYEALARWRHPSLGIVTPDRFIPVAEQNGAIVDIGKAVLEKACRAAAEWDPRLTVAVNLSAVEFRRPDELVTRIKQTLHRTGLDPTRLVIEITESLMLEDSPATRAAVKQLSDYGVRFSLDDFGAGYSSLSYIQDYPFSKIKIDRKFVERIDKDPVSSAIVASVCVLAERTRMEIIAEGVENRVQEIALRRLGVKHAQGFLYGRPRPILFTASTTLQRAAAAG